MLRHHLLRGWHRSSSQLSQSPTAVALVRTPSDNMDLRLKTLVILAVVLSYCSDEAFSQGRRRGSGRGGGGASEFRSRTGRVGFKSSSRCCKILGCYQATCTGGDAGAISDIVQAEIPPDWLILTNQRKLQHGEKAIGSFYRTLEKSLKLFA